MLQYLDIVCDIFRQKPSLFVKNHDKTRYWQTNKRISDNSEMLWEIAPGCLFSNLQTV